MSPRAAWRLEQLGYTASDYVAGKADWTAAGLPTEGTAVPATRIGRFADASVPTCTADEPVATAAARARAAGRDTCVVVNEERVVLGLLRGDRLADDDDARPAGEVMRPGPSTVRADLTLDEVVGRMDRAGTSHVLVTTPAGELVGLLPRDVAQRAAAAGGEGDN